MGSTIEITDAQELEHAATIYKRLQQSLVLLERFELAVSNHAPVGSVLAGDDAATTPFHTSHTVITALTMATENIASLHRLLLVDDQLLVPMYAHYPVMRSTLEAASLARWILAPDDRHERVLRSLRARAEDVVQDHSLRKNEVQTMRSMDAVGGDQETWNARVDSAEESNAQQYAADLQKLREVTRRHGLSWQAVKGGLPHWISLIESVSTVERGTEWMTIPGSHTAGVWKVMSGLSHPSVSRTVNHSSLDRIGDDKPSSPSSSSPSSSSTKSTPGTFLGKFSASLDWTNQALTVTLSATSEAITLFTQRQNVELSAG